jgi:hypothetical protein
MIGQVMQCPPPRPRPSSAPVMVITSMPAFLSSVFVARISTRGDEHEDRVDDGDRCAAAFVRRRPGRLTTKHGACDCMANDPLL